jgi:hypothetical protein
MSDVHTPLSATVLPFHIGRRSNKDKAWLKLFAPQLPVLNSSCQSNALQVLGHSIPFNPNDAAYLSGSIPPYNLQSGHFWDLITYREGVRHASRSPRRRAAFPPA